jgi:hypothetical protein
MGQPFPNESPISTHDTIDLTERGTFSSFEEALGDLGLNQTKRDYEFRQVGANGHILIAKPVRSGPLWAVDLSQGDEWIDNASYDPTTGNIDDSQSAQNQQNAPSVPAGTCPGCGATGLSGKFCHNCAAPLQGPRQITTASAAAVLGLPPGALGGAQVLGVGPGGATVPVVAGPGGLSAVLPPQAGQLQPGQTPQAGAGVMAAPHHINPDRMTGRPEKPVVVPEAMTKTKYTGFEDKLDALLASADDAGTDGQTT